MSTHIPDHWIERTRSVLEIPQNHETERFFEAWQRAEGGEARWNPLNCTMSVGGTVNWDESNYNSIGVKNYKYAFVGIVAIVLTIQQRNADGTLVYGELLENLRNPELTAEEILEKSVASIKMWGTDPSLMLEVLKGID